MIIKNRVGLDNEVSFSLILHVGTTGVSQFHSQQHTSPVFSQSSRISGAQPHSQQPPVFPPGASQFNSQQQQASPVFSQSTHLSLAGAQVRPPFNLNASRRVQRPSWMTERRTTFKSSKKVQKSEAINVGT